MRTVRIVFLATLFLIASAPAIDATSCRDLYSGNDWNRVTVVDEHLTIPNSGEVLHVQPSKNGGVKVLGTNDDGNWQVTVCKAHWHSRATDINPDDITIEATPSRLVADSPDEDAWSVMFIIHAPQQASMSAATINGPVSIADASGTFQVSSKNGPLSLDRVNGHVTARLENGPISISDLSGKFDLETRNGPISADFRDWVWTGATIRLTTENGPLALKSTERFPAGITVRADGHGPVRCNRCGDLRETRDLRQRPRVFRFGPNTEDVVMRTDNGPVTIDVR